MPILFRSYLDYLTLKLKKINADFGLFLDHGAFAITMKKKETKNDAFELWLWKQGKILIEYKKLLRYWEHIYSCRSPVDKVNDRDIDSISNRGNAEYNKIVLL